MPDLIGVSEARARVLSAARPLTVERVAVEAALDRVLAEDLAAATDVPAFSASAMDGYAVHDGPEGRTLTLIGESRAGAPSADVVGADQAVRVSTGAAVPGGATAVIRQEDTDLSGHEIHTRADVQRGENIRHAGEDMRAGTTVVRAGTRLGPAELGAAVAAGAGQLVVGGRPRVTVLCTGDELRAPGEPLGPGEIHNSNAAMLASLTVRAGAALVRATRVPDEFAATQQMIAAGLDEADVVVISGGVSVGPHDHVKAALASLAVGELFWGVALQPGKPTWFGARGTQLVFGLPGNPVSAVVTFALFAAPALAAMQGATPQPQQREAELGAAVRRNARREQALRVRLEQRDGRTVALPNGPQGSHIVSSLLGADALAMIPPGDGELATGKSVALWPLAL